LSEAREALAVKRRTFITLLGGAAAWPLAARAQQGERVRRIGLLMGTADDNIEIETRFGGGDVGRMRAHAAELVALVPDVIVGQTTPAIRALRQATSSIPIVIIMLNRDGAGQLEVSSRARSQPTCRCKRQLSTSWRLTSRPPRRSALPWPRRCSPAPNEVIE